MSGASEVVEGSGDEGARGQAVEQRAGGTMPDGEWRQHLWGPDSDGKEREGQEMVINMG